MSAFSIVEHFDVIEDIGTSQLGCLVEALLDEYADEPDPPRVCDIDLDEDVDRADIMLISHIDIGTGFIYS